MSRSFGSFDEVSDGLVPDGEICELRATRIDEFTMNKSMTGGFIPATMQVVGGKYAGASWVQRFNVDNQNPTAVRIALQDIKSWAIACGVPVQGQQITEEFVANLEGRKFRARIKVRSGGDYRDQNEIGEYLKPGEAVAGGAAPRRSSTPPASRRPASDYPSPEQAAKETPEADDDIPFGAGGSSEAPKGDLPWKR